MSNTSPKNIQRYRIGDWLFDYSVNALSHLSNDETQRLEPKVSELLVVLIEAGGEVVTKDHLLATLWPGMVVGDDTLARTVSRLRSALQDSASNPSYIETIPKKGYRLCAAVSAFDDTSSNRPLLITLCLVLLVISVVVAYWLPTTDQSLQEKLSRADGLYMQFQEHSNEAALALYQEVLDQDSDNPRAQAGLANAMVQRVVRWPEEAYSVAASQVSLTQALASGQLATPEAKSLLERAQMIAQRAVRVNPKDIHAIKSLGFVYSAQGKIELAIEQYQNAIQIDQNAWRSWINLGELLKLNNQPQASLDAFVQAFEAMQAKFQEEPQHIGPWQPELGKIIAASYFETGEFQQTRHWASRVLQLVPFDPPATRLLVAALNAQGKRAEATRICEAYPASLPKVEACL